MVEDQEPIFPFDVDDNSLPDLHPSDRRPLGRNRRLGQCSRMSPESIGGNVPRDYERSARPGSPLRRRIRVPRPWPNESSRYAS